jgi:hypothetical protein
MIWLVDADVKLGAAVQRGALGVALVPRTTFWLLHALFVVWLPVFFVISFFI